MKAFLVQQSYNYPSRFQKALEDGNSKYIKSLIKRGKVVIMEAQPHYDTCGNFIYATLKD